VDQFPRGHFEYFNIVALAQLVLFAGFTLNADSMLAAKILRVRTTTDFAGNLDKVEKALRHLETNLILTTNTDGAAGGPRSSDAVIVEKIEEAATVLAILHKAIPFLQTDLQKKHAATYNAAQKIFLQLHKKMREHSPLMCPAVTIPGELRVSWP
jgi:hypothetical protein